MSLGGLGEKRARLYCEHCKQSVSNSTYYRHRARFFKEETNEWTTSDQAEAGGVDSDSDSSIEWSDGVAEDQEPLEPEEALLFNEGTVSYIGAADLGRGSSLLGAWFTWLGVWSVILLWEGVWLQFNDFYVHRL